MKKLFFAMAIGCSLTAFQSCSKCGQCVVTTSQGTLTNKETGNVYCGNDNNESGSYYKAAKLACEQTEARFKEDNPGSTLSVTGSWEDVK